jgi:hypothetical protein
VTVTDKPPPPVKRTAHQTALVENGSFKHNADVALRLKTISKRQVIDAQADRAFEEGSLWL